MGLVLGGMDESKLQVDDIFWTSPNYPKFFVPIIVHFVFLKLASLILNLISAGMLSEAINLGLLGKTSLADRGPTTDALIWFAYF